MNFNKYRGGSPGQNSPQRSINGKPINSRDLDRQVPQPQEPFRNPNAALNPVPSGPSGAGSGYAVDNHPAGRFGKRQGTKLSKQHLADVGQSRRPKTMTTNGDIFLDGIRLYNERH